MGRERGAVSHLAWPSPVTWSRATRRRARLRDIVAGHAQAYATGGVVLPVFEPADKWLRPTRATGSLVVYGFVAVAVPAGALLLRLASEPTAIAAYLLLAAYAVLGPAPAIRAVALVWLFDLLNPGLAPPVPSGAVFGFLVLSTAAVSVIARGGAAFRRPRLDVLPIATVGLGTLLVFHALVVSPIKDVSVLKAASWTIAMATLLGAWSGLGPDERRKLSRDLFVGLAAVLILSLPLMVLPVGYLRNGMGFQGVLSHPQAFGATMALLCAWATAQLLEKSPPNTATLVVAGLAFVSVVLSESRTGGFALILGLGLSILGYKLLGRRRGEPSLPGLRHVRLLAVLWLTGLGLLVVAPLVTQQAWQFVTKSDRAEVASIGEAYEDSRGRLIDEMMANIDTEPWLGIGFGIASDPSTMRVEREPLFGLPVSAPIEKGVTPIAVVEELGIVGAAFVAFWLVAVLRGAIASGLGPLSVTLTVLALNMGEAVLFSPGGMGLLLILMLAWGATGDREAVHSER